MELTNDMDDGFWLCCVGKGAFVFSVGFVWGVVGAGNLSCIGQSSSSLQVTAFVEFVCS